MSHFEEAEPDLGRKGFQPELRDLAQRIGVVVVGRLSKWRQHLKKDTGEPPDIVSLCDIHDWIANQERHERESPLIISRTDAFLPTMKPSLSSTPESEQDVIALFNQLLAGGVIRGIKLMSTSQHQKYDGIFRLVLSEPFKNHIFDVEHNPLGIESSACTTVFESEPKVIEYKYSLDGLMEEIEKGEKAEREISLAVAWTMGTRWSERYEVTSLLDFDNLQHRYFHGGTHILRSCATRDTVFPVVILSDWSIYVIDRACQDYGDALT